MADVVCQHARTTNAERTIMRIICLEEHAIDAALAKASLAAEMREASYMSDLDSRVRTGLDTSDDPRPRVRAIPDIAPLLRDIGAGRIADMDANGIDMQVLSYSNASQLVPSEQAIDLTRAANDRMAEAVRSNPSRFGGFATLP